MGNNPPPAKRPTMEDTLIEMKMSSKRMARESAKSLKESNAYMKKAKRVQNSICKVQPANEPNVTFNIFSHVHSKDGTQDVIHW